MFFEITRTMFACFNVGLPLCSQELGRGSRGRGLHSMTDSAQTRLIGIGWSGAGKVQVQNRPRYLTGGWLHPRPVSPAYYLEYSVLKAQKPYIYSMLM